MVFSFLNGNDLLHGIALLSKTWRLKIRKAGLLDQMKTVKVSGLVRMTPAIFKGIEYGLDVVNHVVLLMTGSHIRNRGLESLKETFSVVWNLITGRNMASEDKILISLDIRSALWTVFYVNSLSWSSENLHQFREGKTIKTYEEKNVTEYYNEEVDSPLYALLPGSHLKKIEIVAGRYY